MKENLHFWLTVSLVRSRGECLRFNEFGKEGIVFEVLEGGFETGGDCSMLIAFGTERDLLVSLE